MHESEKFRVEGETIERICGASVHLIAYDRMSGLGQMRANLILASGLQRHLEHRIRPGVRDRAVVRDGQLRIGMRLDTLHAQVLSFEKVRSNRSRRRLNRSF